MTPCAGAVDPLAVSKDIDDEDNAVRRRPHNCDRWLQAYTKRERKRERESDQREGTESKGEREKCRE